MKLSIVIPTFNRARLLRVTLPALAEQQTEEGVDYELLFVSNGSTDDTAEVLAEAQQRWPGRIRSWRIEPTGGPSAPRNRGIREALGDIIVILDDDVRPDPDLVLQFARFHREHPAAEDAAIGEAYVPDHLLGDPVSLFHVYPYHTIRNGAVVGYDYFWTCCVSMKRSFMLERGMFDERFLFNEDVICGHRLHRAGMRLHFVKAARGEHLHQLTTAGLAAKAEFTGRWIYATVREIPEREVFDRYGVLAPQLGPRLFLRRLLRRLAFRAIDNSLTHGALKLLGATNGSRSRWSDMHYMLLFRRGVVAGYHQARREQLKHPDRQGEGWHNRGDR